MTLLRLTVAVAGVGYLLTVAPLFRAANGQISWFFLGLLVWYAVPGGACCLVARIAASSNAKFRAAATGLAMAGALVATFSGVRIAWSILEIRDAQAAIGFLFVPVQQLFWAWPFQLVAIVTATWPRRSAT